MPSKIEISHKTIIFTVFFVIFLWFLVEIREIIFLLYISFILMSAINPVTELLERIKIHRAISVILVYLCLLFFITFIGRTVIPPLVSETIHLGERMPEYLKNVLPAVQIDYQMITQQVAPIGENLLKVTVSLFSNVFALFSVFVISFYFLMERQYIKEHLTNNFGREQAEKFEKRLRKVEEKLGAWVRGQLILAVTIWLATFIGLSILGLPYILPLSIFAGLLEIVPIIGPVISAVPAILIALTISPVMASATVVLYVIIQQIEAHAVVPMVMKKAVGLPPVISIIALMVGAKLAGIGGALLAVPLVLTLEAVFSDYLKKE